MWRGFHKMDAAHFDAMASLPSEYPTASSSGVLALSDPQGQPLFAHVEDLNLNKDRIHEAGEGEGKDTYPCSSPSSISLVDKILAMAEERGYSPALLNTGDGKQEVGSLYSEVRQSQRCILEVPELAEEIWERVKENVPPSAVLPGPRWLERREDKTISTDTDTSTGADTTTRVRMYEWVPVGVNPCLRVLKYTSGDHFEVHQDGSYTSKVPDADADAASEGGEKGGGRHEQRSFLTLQLYLNSGGGVDFEGGATRFISLPREKMSKKTLAKSAATATNPTTSVANTSISVEHAGYHFKINDVVPRTGRALLFQHNIWHEGQRVVCGTKIVLRSEIMYEKREKL